MPKRDYVESRKKVDLRMITCYIILFYFICLQFKWLSWSARLQQVTHLAILAHRTGTST